MEQTVETKPIRTYHVMLEGHTTPIRIRADIMCEEGGALTFKREGHRVGTVKAPVSAWWIDEPRALVSGG